MKTRYVLTFILAAACSTFDAGEAKAQYGLNAGCGYGYGCGIYDYGRLYRVLADNVPHYAAFPPVYYSAPVPRTYGYSPFASPPGVMTPDLVGDAEPVEIVNPHFKPASDAAPEAPEDEVTRTQGAAAPLLVMNPYVSTRVAGLDR